MCRHLSWVFVNFSDCKICLHQGPCPGTSFSSGLGLGPPRPPLNQGSIRVPWQPLDISTQPARTLVGEPLAFQLVPASHCSGELRQRPHLQTPEKATSQGEAWGGGPQVMHISSSFFKILVHTWQCSGLGLRVHS